MIQLSEEENPTIKKMARAAWKAHYNDLGIYRVIVRYRKHLFALACAAFLMGIPSAFGHVFTQTGEIIFVSLWLFLLLVVFAGAIDHIYIGLKIKRVQREIQRNGIFLTKKEILFYCRDLIR